MKKLISFILVLIMVLSSFLVQGRELSTYQILCNMDSELINRFVNNSVSDGIIASWMGEIDDQFDQFQNEMERDVLEKIFIGLLFSEFLIENEKYADIYGELFSKEFLTEMIYMLENLRIPETFEIFFLSVMYDKFSTEIIDPVPPEIIETPGIIEKPTPTPSINPIFSDLENYNWAEININELYKIGVIKGYEDGTFRPQNEITRSEFVKLIALTFLDKGYKNETSSFSDVSKEAWYYDYLLKAEYFSLFSLIYEGEFKPNQPITRQEMCAIAYRAIKRNSFTLPTIYTLYEFEDYYNISNYAYDPIRELQKAGVINGVGNNRFEPNKTTTRAEVARLIDVLRILCAQEIAT